MQIGIVGYLVPNCSNKERLSILSCTPNKAASSNSLNEIPFGVNIIFFGLKLAVSPSFISSNETVSSPLPSSFISPSIDKLDNALTA